MDSKTAARLGGAIQVALAAGFGVGAIVTWRHLAAHGELPMTPFGFRAFSGPLERLGRPAFSRLLASMAAVCAADAIAGGLLLRLRRSGLRLGAATALPGFALSIGFALPFMLAGIPLRLALALLGRSALR